MLILLITFVAGLLTALAPCVLPLLPVILGGSFDMADRDRKRPYVVVGSLVLSLVAFTILLKVSSILVGIDPRVWSVGSGILVILLGFFMLFPNLWAQAIGRLGIEAGSQTLLSKAFQNKNRTLSAVLTGAALGPVFSSCSPTYAWVIATVLPVNVVLGTVYLLVYCLGLAAALLAIAVFGRKLLMRIKWVADPHGTFQRAIAVLFIIVGIFVATGWSQKVQTWLVDKDILKLIHVEQKLVPKSSRSTKASPVSADKERFNVTPYVAPDFTGVNDWINSSPLTMAHLKGKVVLVDFWTYSCINCQRTQPYLNAWYEKYKDAGLVIVGVHAPEFSFEKVPANVRRAVADEHIAYPVALDNNFATWQAYGNQYWPAKYLIDADGQVRYIHFGEGAYDETEMVIQKLLSEAGQKAPGGVVKAPSADAATNGQTPETYLGYARAERFANASQFTADKPVDYGMVSQLSSGEWSLGGKWQVGKESAMSKASNATLGFNFSAREVYLVMDGPVGAKVGVSVQGLSTPGGADVNSQGQVTLDGPRLYKLVKAGSVLSGNELTLTFPAGVTVNAFTFGG